ncbi:MAG: DUF3783 domain-containing protein [Clostridium sp.]|nr:DUF3783 domain-containing protein [Clostridium sp.]MCM1399026.1 DUF3783 domain-containing protein [Clostridium sp.]MCM1458885.1 DUF3783 domain-containing protein [Bacteroides sp.]
MSKMLLLYSYPNEDIRKISKLCLEHNMECKKIPKGRFLQTIGAHIGLMGQNASGERYEGSDLPEPVMVFSGIASGELDGICDLLGNLEIRQGIKAIATPHNVNWTILDLYGELAREREEISSFAK